MTPLKLCLTCSLLLLCILFTSSCSANDEPSEIVLIASTPGDELIKSLLTIPSDTKVDFIRWNLTLKTKNANQYYFVLNIAFGETQPNTLGFKRGGEKRSFQGIYSVSESQNKNINREIYRLKSDKLPTGIIMVKLNDNIFHLLTPQNQLMIGNGGWSYTLNRKEPIKSVVLPSSTLTKDTSLQVIFDGRTPCHQFAKDNDLPVDPDCFKLKWKIILNKEAGTLLPTTYLLKTTFNRETDMEGKWEIIRGIPSNPNAVIYQLYLDKQDKFFSLLVGDDNVLFFLNKDNVPYVGNGDFSFTLNKRIQQ